MVKTVKHTLNKAKVTKDVTLDTLISRFLATYHNVRHATTSRTPAELLLNREPRTHLSLVYPCTAERLEQTTEMQVGDKQPRRFAANDNVMVRDLHPNATDKWRRGVVTMVLGPLNYEVTVDGHSRQAHVDHLLPDTANSDIQSSIPVEARGDQGCDDATDDTIVPLVPLRAKDNSMNESEGQELGIIRPHRNWSSPYEADRRDELNTLT